MRSKEPYWMQARGLADLTGDPAERLWSKVKRGDKSECWLWAGTKKNGYGVLRQRHGPRAENKLWSIQAHRVAYELERGAIPKNKLLRHVVCNNTLCCNPWHCEPGTHSENMADMARDGSQKGENNASALLTAGDVDEIRRDRRKGVTLKLLAKRYGVHFATIDYAARGGTWENATEPPVVTKLQRITKEQLAEMYSLWKAGSNFKELELKYGFHSSTIGARIRDLNRQRKQAR